MMGIKRSAPSQAGNNENNAGVSRNSWSIESDTARGGVHEAFS